MEQQPDAQAATVAAWATATVDTDRMRAKMVFMAAYLCANGTTVPAAPQAAITPFTTATRTKSTLTSPNIQLI
jgi:hypothetical protein